MNSLSTGALFQNFTVDKLICEGLTSLVYRLTQETSDYPVALKHYKPNVKIETRRREFDIQSTLDSEKIVKILSHDPINYDWVITEFHGDGDMLDLMQGLKRPLSEDSVRFLFRQVVESVHYLHGIGIFHRDIKLENLLFCRKTLRTKLCDFGFAVRHNEGAVHRCTGTPGYTAPELQNGPLTDPNIDASELEAADVFSLGAVLFVLAYGHQPFKDSKRSKCAYWRLIEEGKWTQYWSTIEKFQNHKLSTELKLLIQSLLAPAQERMSLEDLMESEWYNGKVASSKQLFHELE